MFTYYYPGTDHRTSYWNTLMANTGLNEDNTSDTSDATESMTCQITQWICRCNTLGASTGVIK